MVHLSSLWAMLVIIGHLLEIATFTSCLRSHEIPLVMFHLLLRHFKTSASYTTAVTHSDTKNTETLLKVKKQLYLQTPPVTTKTSIQWLPGKTMSEYCVQRKAWTPPHRWVCRWGEWFQNICGWGWEFHRAKPNTAAVVRQNALTHLFSLIHGKLPLKDVAPARD